MILDWKAFKTNMVNIISWLELAPWHQALHTIIIFLMYRIEKHGLVLFSPPMHMDSRCLFVCLSVTKSKFIAYEVIGQWAPIGGELM